MLQAFVNQLKMLTLCLPQQDLSTLHAVSDGGVDIIYDGGNFWVDGGWAISTEVMGGVALKGCG